MRQPSGLPSLRAALAAAALGAAALAALTAAASLPSCNPYNPSYEGLACGPADDCPSGYTCVEDACTAAAAELCGDGLIVGDEVCDDGNRDGGDGCDAACAVATCYAPVTHTVAEALADAACPTVYVHGATHVGPFVIARDVTVLSVGARAAVLDGANTDSVVTVQESSTVTLRGFTIVKGRAASGGGILNRGGLVLDQVIITDNTAAAESPSGGGIFNSGTLTVSGSVISRNHLVTTAVAGATPVLSGGGIYSSGGTVRLDGASIVENNDAIAIGIANVVGRGAGIGANNTAVTLSAGSVVRNNVLDLDGRPGRATASGAGLFLNGGTLTVNGGSVIEGNTGTAKGVNSGGNIGANATGGGFYASNTPLTFNVAFVRNNRALAQGEQQTFASGGGGVLRTGSITFQSLEVTGNRVRAEGLTAASSSALASAGGLDIDSASGTITDAKISANEVSAVSASSDLEGVAAAGGALFTSFVPNSQQSLIFLRSTVDGNRVISEDGSARVGGLSFSTSSTDITANLIACTISGNTVQGPSMAVGGGIQASASDSGSEVNVSLVNSTVSGNKVDALTGIGRSGGLELSTGGGNAQSSITLASSTITKNVVVGATSSAGGLNVIRGTGSAITSAFIKNTILSGNQAGANPDCLAAGLMLASGGYNLLGVTAGCTYSGTTTGNLTGAANLGDLADNGGTTRTHEINNGSQVINAGDPAGCTDANGSALSTDQRGLARVAGGRCDMGAFERQ